MSPKPRRREVRLERGDARRRTSCRARAAGRAWRRRGGEAPSCRPGPVYPPTRPSMLTVGALTRRSSEARQGRSCAQRSTESARFARASSSRAAATSSMARSAAETGRAASAKPSIAGSPSGVTRVARACTRWKAGLSSRARFAECTSFVGPRPQRSPLATSSSSTTPLAPSDTVTVPSASCAGGGHEDAHAVGEGSRSPPVAARSGWKCGEPISSSPSATRTRLTGGFLPAPRITCSASSRAASGPFWLTAPRPTTTLPSPGLSTSAASKGGDVHSDGSTCFTSYMK